MTTIDQLPAAGASADTDLLLVSQNGIDRSVTRAIFLSGVQQQIALSGGQLVGRASAGVGPTETITIGANLALSNGALSATVPPFTIANLPAGHTPGIYDPVPLAQNGSNAAVGYAAFMAGISAVPGVTASQMLATPTLATTSRTLADTLSDTVTVEAFGAVGDGVTDDSTAIAAALASGRPVRLGAKTYVVNGQFTVTVANAVLIGVPGLTTLRRGTQQGNGAWILINSASFTASGIMFDANVSVTQDSWGLLVAPTCLSSDFHRCGFANARGTSQGCGIVYQASDPAVVRHTLDDCEMGGNAVHGLWAQALSGMLVIGCRAHGNGQYGIVLDYTDPAFAQKIHDCQVISCRAWGNARGISIGNFNATNTTPPVWGNANHDAHDVLVASNHCHDNTIYGIAVSGLAISVVGNTLARNGSSGNGGAGILANMSGSRVSGNTVTQSGQYGIDAGGSIDSEIDGNLVDGAVHGINPGGSVDVRVRANRVQNCSGWTVLVNNVETDGNGVNFGLACSGLRITDNALGFAMGNGGGGVLLLDAPAGTVVQRNAFIGTAAATVGQCLWSNAASVLLGGNSWNGAGELSAAPIIANGLATMVFADAIDAVVLSGGGTVQAMASVRQQALAGQIAYIAVTAGGSGYSQATVTVVGGGGSGAAARAMISSGAVIGIVVTAPGSGYGSGTTVTIAGDGQGAVANASVGLAVPDGRRLRVRCLQPTIFAAGGSVPPQNNATGADTALPANAVIDWTAVAGAWQADTVPLAEYLQPSTAAVTLRSVTGDIALSAAGHLRIVNTAEPAGYLSAIGRGSPLGVVAAPPGSDYRNLDGGAFTTLWIKQTATDATGWVAIA